MRQEQSNSITRCDVFWSLSEPFGFLDSGQYAAIVQDAWVGHRGDLCGTTGHCAPTLGIAALEIGKDRSAVRRRHEAQRAHFERLERLQRGRLIPVGALKEGVAAEGVDVLLGVLRSPCRYAGALFNIALRSNFLWSPAPLFAGR